MVLELGFLFFARTLDMCLGTMRHLFVIRGRRWEAGLMGFFEIFIYTLALAIVVEAGADTARLIAFCFGFSAGIVLGITIEDHLAFGFRLVQATVAKADAPVVSYLRKMGIPVTVHEANGLDGEKLVLNMVMRRRRARRIANFIARRVPGAFVISTEPKHFVGGRIAS